MTASHVVSAVRDTLLERSDELGRLADVFASIRRTGRGHLVLVAGEAGIGKTSLVQAFVDDVTRARVLSGACEALRTPRPLGPLLDIAVETGGPLAELVENGASPSDVLTAFAAELRRRSPTVVVLEDLHWSDEATLDLIRLLARRVTTLPALFIATYRNDMLARHHPLRVALGELSRSALTRIALSPLSLSAVTKLVGPSGMSAEDLHERTGGNPFYVTEALAAGAETIPDTVRDAVLARAARLGPEARRLLDAVAIAPPRAELWLLEALAGDDLARLEECIACGMLQTRDDAVSFRHEIARVAVADALPADRSLELNRAALATLAGAQGKRVDLARLAHHAEAAGDAAAVLEFAPAAGERAAAVGAHVEAAAQYERALRFADSLPGERRAELLERRSYESYLTASIATAIETRRQALAEHHARGDRLREGDNRRWLSRLAWYAGDRRTAEDEGRLAIDLLEGLPPGRELAMAYSNLSQLAMLAADLAGARRWGLRAIELAELVDEPAIVVHALNNIGTLELARGLPEGAKRLARSLELALAAGLEEDVARAHVNLATCSVRTRAFAAARRHLENAIAYCTERDFDTYLLYVTGWKARWQLDQGRWLDAGATAGRVVADGCAAMPSRIMPLVVLGILRARRGDPDSWAPLDEALALAEATGELQRLAPVAAARAEAHWLAGRPERIAADTEHAFAHAVERGDPWLIGELSVWRRRGGIVDDSPAPPAGPFELELQGDAAGAAKLWRKLGCRYDAALALGDDASESALRSALADLQELGARPAAARVARALRERGARDLTRGPRASTRTNPAGLTARELEVLALLADGLRNAHIADRLVLSARTVDHHVSAILRKLKAESRTEAAVQAGRLGLLER